MPVDTRIPLILMQSTLSRLAWENGRQVRAMGVVRAVVHIFNEIAMHAWAQASKRLAKDKQSKSWSKSEPSHSGKGKRKEHNGKSKGNSKGTKSANQGAKGLHKSKTSKTGLSSLENAKSETNSGTRESTYVCTTDLSWNDGWNCDEWNDGWSSDEWNDDWS